MKVWREVFRSFGEGGDWVDWEGWMMGRIFRLMGGGIRGFVIF